jgi:hypothetical protein
MGTCSGGHLTWADHPIRQGEAAAPAKPQHKKTQLLCFISVSYGLTSGVMH